MEEGQKGVVNYRRTSVFVYALSNFIQSRGRGREGVVDASELKSKTGSGSFM